MRDKEVHTFLSGIGSKVKVIAQVEIELTYYDVTIQHFSHYATQSPSRKLVE